MIDSCATIRLKILEAENQKEKGKVKQRVIATVGRMDQLQAKGRVETLIFERLWERAGIKDAIIKALNGRSFQFDVERTIFLTVLHRLMVSGSDRFCDRWHRDYVIEGIKDLDLHHLYRAMAFLGEELSDQNKA